MIRPLRLLLPMLMLAGPVHAATCVSQSSFDWAGIGTGDWSCGGGTASDHYVVAWGHEVSITQDIVQAGVSGIGIVVRPGGALTADVVADRIELALGDLGLDCRGGSLCRLHGKYRSYGQSAPALLDDPDTGSFFRAGRVQPCGLAGCGVTPERVAFTWQQVSAPNGLRESLAAVKPGDVACFFDPDPTDLRVGADSGNCYEVTQANVSGTEYALELDVRQGQYDQSGFPLARRHVQALTLASDAGAGERTIRVEPSNAISSDGLHVGRWLRFAASDGMPEPVAYKISETSDGANADAIRIGDSRGTATARLAGSAAWIDYGWAPGDAFFVEAPVVVSSATPAAISTTDSRVLLKGVTDLQAVVLSQLGGVRADAATFARWRDVWLRDAGDHTGANSEIAIRLGRIRAARFERTLITGGSPNPGLDKMHGIGLWSSSDLVFEDLTTRHLGDDVIVSDELAPSDRLHFERIHAAFRNDNAQSQQLFDPSSRAVNGEIVDAICDDCTDDDTTISGLDASTGAVFTVSGLLAWGTDGPTVSSTSSPIAFEDVVSIGASASGAGAFVPARVDRFLVRDATNRSPLPSALLGVGAMDARNGIVRDIELSSTEDSAFVLDGDAVLENVLLADVAQSGSCATASCAVVRFQGDAAQSVSRVTIVRSLGSTAPFRRGFSLRGGASYLSSELRGTLISNFSEPEAEGVGGNASELIGPSAIAMSALGFDSVASPLAGGLPAPADSLFSAPAFVDPSTGRFDVAAGSAHDLADCGVARGVSSPGARYRWLHAKSKLAPERLADDYDFDGAVEDSGAAACAGGSRALCADNCAGSFNPEQSDADADAVGDACDDHCLAQPTAIASLVPGSALVGEFVEVNGTGIGSNAWVELDGERVPLDWLNGVPRFQAPPGFVGQAFQVVVVNPEGCRSLAPVRLTIDAPGACGLTGLEAAVVAAYLMAHRKRAKARGAEDSA